MSDHLAEALRLIDVSCEPGLEDRQDDQFETATLATAQIHATLEVAEHVEYAGEQLRRLADGVEQIVELVRERLPVAAGAVRATDDEPCAYDWGDRVYCATPRSSHSTAHHEWIGAPR